MAAAIPMLAATDGRRTPGNSPNPNDTQGQLSGERRSTISWPNSRLTNYVPGAQVRSADLNQLQDAIIGGKHGELPLILHAADGRAVLGNPTYPSPYVLFSGSGDVWHQTVPLLGGAVIRTIRWTVQRTGGSLELWLFRVNLETGLVDGLVVSARWTAS